MTPTSKLAALALTALIGAGCGSDAPSEDAPAAERAAASGRPTATATAATGAPTTGVATTTRLSVQEKGVKLAACIRAHGVPHFPDPGPKGDYDFGIDVSPAVWKKATEACKDLTPPGTFSSERSPKQQTDAVRFATCVRANGVKDFPDPADGDPLIDTTRIPSSNRPGGMDRLDAATGKCRGILSLGAGGQR